MRDDMRRFFLIICSLLPISEMCPAQSYTDIMSRLISYALELRTDGSDDTVYEKLQKDDKWTLMNEVADDLGGQCSLRERIGRFGINDLAIRIEEKNRGKSLAGKGSSSSSLFHLRKENGCRRKPLQVIHHMASLLMLKAIIMSHSVSAKERLLPLPSLSLTAVPWPL